MPSPTDASSMSRDRSTALTLVGVLQIGLGALCVLLVAISSLQFLPAFRTQVAAAGGSQPTTGGIVIGMAFYTLLAGFFVWTGVGAIRKRRWVRPIVLIVSWMWLIAGVIGAAVAALLVPRVLRLSAGQAHEVPPAVGVIIGVVVAGIIAIFYIVLPLGFVLFYGSPHVQATLDARDPSPRWTDGCPLPVLGLSLFLGLSAVSTLPAAALAVFPLFSTLLTGPSAVVLALALTALYAYFARASYRRQSVGWWGPLVAISFASISTGFYFWRGGLNEYIAAIGVSPEQGRLFLETGVFSGGMFMTFSALWVVAAASYLLWVRKYFPGRTQAAP